jgi:hypothetical protein
MKRYVKLNDGKIIDTEKESYIVHKNDLILHRQYETVAGPEIKPGQTVVPSIAIIRTNNEYTFIGTIKTESDNVLELIEIGDLVEFYDGDYKIAMLEIIDDEMLKVVQENNEMVTKIYVKQGDNYVLEWRKE